jgi:hypothetical protein
MLANTKPLVRPVAITGAREEGLFARAVRHWV